MDLYLTQLYIFEFKNKIEKNKIRLISAQHENLITSKYFLSMTKVYPKK